MELTSGLCTDVGSYIDTEEECREAAASMGWPVDENFLVASRGDWPPGCWLNFVGNMARFNTMSNSPELCQRIDTCLCRTEIKRNLHFYFPKNNLECDQSEFPPKISSDSDHSDH